jgi:curved DNA-binding protein CbpA
MLTWYDVLGVLPGATPGEVRSACQARARLLAPHMLAGAPATVLKAADAAKAAVGEAWRVLGDPAARPLYDSQIGARGNGEGLDRPEPVPSGPGGELYGRDINADMVTAALADLMTSHPAPARRVIVPDLHGLLAGSCLRVAATLGCIWKWST